MLYDIFISYSRRDTAVADRICAAFDRAGISYFIDRQGIGGAVEFPKVLANAIIESRLFLFLGSENSYREKSTNNEVIYAFNQKPRNSLLPYIIDGSRLPLELQSTFASINIRNIKEHPIEPTLVDDVLQLLGREREVEKPEPKPVPRPTQKARVRFSRRLWRTAGITGAGALLVAGMIALLSRPRGTDTIVEDVAEVAVPENETFTVGDVSFTMVYVEGGTFKMGCTSEQGGDCKRDEKPAHKVTLDGYYIGETEVTQALWEAVMGTTVRQQRDKADASWPMCGEGGNYPMYYVSWDECQEFIDKLNSMTGQSFRLPTEAEWEYAARGGSKSRGHNYSGSESIDSVAWYFGNSGSMTHPVAQKQASELGIYDMSGNVWEWCNDWYGRYGKESQSNPQGRVSGSRRVYRGGGWDINARYCRVSNRDYYDPSYRNENLGFRLAR